ncbi:MAG: serine hydrolase domain-containing protein, partial [Halieaceae bacterium]|nr:serine hydrolase domain-containing protein [Halieaceae bacterium]
SRGEIGAAVAVAIDGELVVDLWGGMRDRERALPWERESVANVWSTTKGVAAACIAMLVSRGKLAYGDPVAQHWPEFATHGKGSVTVAQLLSHQAGLCGLRRPATLADLCDSRGMAAELAAMEPWWTPGDGSGYHAITVGFLVDELVRRIDGRDLRDFVAEELREAFGLNLSIGLPGTREADAATAYAPAEQGSGSDSAAPALDALRASALANPALSPTVSNEPAWRQASIPSANGFADARSLAQLYGALAGDGRLAGVELVGSGARSAMRELQYAGHDRVLVLPVRWACGFLLNSLGLYGPGENSFGHSGWGGSFAFGDPECRLGCAYVMNAMGRDLVGDPRATGLVAALYDVLTTASAAEGGTP